MIAADYDYTLGVNIGFHDSSAALLRDGEIRAIVETERLSRRKHAFAQPPAAAVHACLEIEGIDPQQVSDVAVGWDFSGTPMGRNRRFQGEEFLKLVFGDPIPAHSPRVTWVPHHMAHAASAYCVSGYPRAAVLVMDGSGERDATSIGVADESGIRFTRTWSASQSLGFFYTAATKWAGFGDWGTGKLMGLAAYGRPQGEMALRVDGDGYLIEVDGAPLTVAVSERAAAGPLMAYFPGFDAAITPTFCSHFPYAVRQGEEAIAYADFAATTQVALEEAVLATAEGLRRSTGHSAIVLAGGVAMNCTMVGRLVRSGIFDDVYVPPIPTDAGVSLGAALVVARARGHREHAVMDHAYWGPPVGTDQEIEKAIAETGSRAQRMDEPALLSLASQTIAQGGVVAWARGRGEVGQRALGTRSLLADPRDRRSLERLNVIKGREMWRPVAPSILAEHVDSIMATPVGSPAKFMLAAGEVRRDVRQDLPAVTHVDGSARPQRVEKSTNQPYWELIDRFRSETGQPVVINTSLNLAGEPIVSSAQDAVSTFSRSPLMAGMVLGNYWVTHE